METPFADSKNIQDRAEDNVELSSAISDQLFDMQALASSAKKNFKDWDTDRNGTLTLPELSDVYGSSEFSLQDRATASILSENYSLFGNLCAPQLSADINKQSYTKPGYRFLESTFGNDGVRDGITQKDLTVFSMLAGKEGEQKFVNDADMEEKRSLGLSGLMTVLNGGMAIAVLGNLFGRKPADWLTTTIGGLNAGLAISSGSEVIDSLGKSDLHLMEQQFKNRKAMLDTMEIPRL